MNADRERLMRELWGEGETLARREATLRAGQRVMRFRRWRRRVIHTGTLVVLVAGIGFGLLHRGRTRPSSVVSAPPAPAQSQPTRYLTDDQLLALFPGTPVGLAKVGDREVLVFPRPEDEAKFVGRF